MPPFFYMVRMTGLFFAPAKIAYRLSVTVFSQALIKNKQNKNLAHKLTWVMIQKLHIHQMNNCEPI